MVLSTLFTARALCHQGLGFRYRIKMHQGLGVIAEQLMRSLGRYRGISLAKKRTPLGPYRKPMSTVLGGWVFSYG